ncbi:tripartite tricarboxylate transporter TctB family protein [Ferrovibrio sp.]|uniref:tripartite tricarboxylate transporter TctB family protein n=1 Tax=Ferrovibrio sp. TaxID=1917215 RepID=UPI0026190974|nr:tripartite tricarboxylate transporter TctB family protein [Ferrovibrio sp.]
MAAPIIRNPKDFLSGLMFIAFGAAFIYIAQDYTFGSPRRMGPAFFPVVLAIILVLIGLVVAVRGLLVTEDPPRGFTWRGLLLVIVSTLLFGALVRGAGLVVATPVLVCISAFASHLFKWKITAIIAIGLTAFCVIVFVYALGLPMPVIGPWFGR